MAKNMTQREQNPFPYSDSNKRYFTYDYYLKTAFGGKCAKIPLDIGFTCPNRDGTAGHGGCIYCSGNSAAPTIPKHRENAVGDGIHSAVEKACAEIRMQYEAGRQALAKKWDVSRCIPYFQAGSCTYAACGFLEKIFEFALFLPGSVELNIGTRPDCIDNEKAAMLEHLSMATGKVITLELGLQTVHDETAARINRCHSFAAFEAAFRILREAAPSVRIAVHLINGLPGESEAMMRQSAAVLAALAPDEVKIHLLHIIKGTPLATIFENGGYIPMEREDYIRVVCDQLELLPKETVIGRITGDGIAGDLLAPLWSIKKTTVINDIDKELFRRDSFQGKKE